jgi:hypothetical protein
VNSCLGDYLLAPLFQLLVGHGRWHCASLRRQPARSCRAIATSMVWRPLSEPARAILPAVPIPASKQGVSRRTGGGPPVLC